MPPGIRTCPGSSEALQGMCFTPEEEAGHAALHFAKLQAGRADCGVRACQRDSTTTAEAGG